MDCRLYSTWVHSDCWRGKERERKTCLTPGPLHPMKGGESASIMIVGVQIRESSTARDM